MKRTIMLIASVVLLAGCSEDDRLVPVVKPSHTSTYIDLRDNVEYGVVRYGNLEWMTSNLKFVPSSGDFYPSFQPSGSYLNPYFEEYHMLYGCLYDYPTAVANVPEGWRIPTDEEWKTLESAFGMSTAELDQKGSRGSVTANVMRQGVDGSGFNLLHSGYHLSWPGLKEEGACGYYWSSTTDPAKTDIASVFYRRINYNAGAVIRESTVGAKKFAVRCVRDVR